MTAIDEAAGAPKEPTGEPKSSHPASEAGADSDLLTVTVHAKPAMAVHDASPRRDASA